MSFFLVSKRHTSSRTEIHKRWSRFETLANFQFWTQKQTFFLQIKSGFKSLSSNCLNCFSFFLRFKPTDQAGTKISNHERMSRRAQFCALCSRFLPTPCRRAGEWLRRRGISQLPSLKEKKILSLLDLQNSKISLTNAISPTELPHRPIAVGHLASEAHRIQYERNEEGEQRAHHHQHSDAIELILQVGVERFQADPGQQSWYGIGDERDDAKDCSRFDVD